MSTDPKYDKNTDVGHSPDDGKSRWAAGDDERENREEIAKTGEPKRDALGNADGAS